MKNLIKFILLIAVSISLSFGENSSNDKSSKTKGKEIYQYWCATCHAKNMPGTNALAVLYKDTGVPAVLEEREDLTSDFIAFYVRNGKHSMPFFRKTEINDEELKALQDYLRKGNE
ncbi:MAG: cytochrome c [Campylobacter sp.]|nr:cytochrome c [Campylobacter sp.]